jgi:glycerol-3-phosphate cytidylyltransferase-like family protein
LDTRTKIRQAAEAAALRHRAAEQKRVLRVATGHFDPLLVEHARLLGEFARPEAWLVVVVTPSRSPLLAVRARAELVASLDVVEHVFAAADEGEAERVLADLAPQAVLRWDADDERRTAELIAHVHSRY